ncbi:MAG: hypothetical protein MJ016_04275 [Victivallaceae bacterium]|nr:hypothetical protein [Victivallaceae bacterium]
MSEENNDLVFSGDGVSGFRLRADDARARRSLEAFSRLVNVGLSASEGRAHAHLRSTAPPPEVAGKFHLHQDRRTLSFFRGENDDFYLHANDDESRRFLYGKLQKLLLYGYATGQMQSGGAFDLLHGALLEMPDGTGTVLFGDSGIGKSTSVRRWRAAGRTAIADDMLYFYRRGEQWYARPLPTWSACIEGRGLDCYDFQREVAVTRAMLLLRDPAREHIGDLSPVHFRLGVVKAVSETSSWLFPYVPIGWRDRLAGALMKFSGEMLKSFPPRALFAHLDGDLVATLDKR